MELKGKKIGFGITGSFCTVTAALDVLKELKKQGADLYPVVSNILLDNSSRFHCKEEYFKELEEITGNKITDTIIKAEEFGPKIKLDLMVVVPCSGNSAAKIANGIWDTPVLMSVKATLRNENPVVLSIYTNDGLTFNGENIFKLYNLKNIYLTPLGQDDPIKKPASLTANITKTIDTIKDALDGKQIQPFLVTFEN